jgi:hypothetical protein
MRLFFEPAENSQSGGVRSLHGPRIAAPRSRCTASPSSRDTPYSGDDRCLTPAPSTHPTPTQRSLKFDREV